MWASVYDKMPDETTYFNKIDLPILLENKVKLCFILKLSIFIIQIQVLHISYCKNGLPAPLSPEKQREFNRRPGCVFRPYCILSSWIPQPDFHSARPSAAAKWRIFITIEGVICAEWVPTFKWDLLTSAPRGFIYQVEVRDRLKFPFDNCIYKPPSSNRLKRSQCAYRLLPMFQFLPEQTRLRSKAMKVAVICINPGTIIAFDSCSTLYFMPKTW